eukprot:Protomagalhaensia_wolfi_Nauph_80__3716@NODE_3758_length_718_cov_3_703976_g2965_i0_p2_GENE_NODE_3758_length_718_cov_3_703976_g2965_i0NODE_3758_length_718_cov_3_703976_g2965_i0_p2_ORF_typecomplete_len105_score8_20_NODE_3758_length_718_cov_3_703976_g2965_i0404718
MVPKTGENTKVVPSEFYKQSELVSSSKPGTIKNTVESTITRHFIRNPFTLDNSGWRNCIQFWTDEIPSNIDYHKLEAYDKVYKERLMQELRETELRMLRKDKNV